MTDRTPSTAWIIPTFRPRGPYFAHWVDADGFHARYWEGPDDPTHSIDYPQDVYARFCEIEDVWERATDEGFDAGADPILVVFGVVHGD